MLLTRYLSARVAVLAAAFVFTCANAAAPFSKAQIPGSYRMMLGDFEVTALSDGTVALPVSTSSPKRRRRRSRRLWRDGI